MKDDIIDVEITETGLIRSTTPKISAANHSGAADFFRILQRTTGGEQTTSKRNKALEGQVHSHGEQKAGQ